MQDFKKINPVNFDGVKKIFFVGIGGIGVSALVKLFKSQGKKVAGSDKYSSEITDNLKKRGIKVFIGHKEKNLELDTDLVIYSVAVGEDIAERKKATKLRIRQLSYPEVLGLISKDKYTIAVSGTHGKSTTTAMLGLILAEVGFDPTVIVGSKVKHPGFDENLRTGKSNYLIVEGCEWRAHMLELSPKIIILTNIEKDHLDYYKTFKNIKIAFKKYVSKLPKNGLLVVNADDKVCLEVAKSARCKVVTYGIKNKKADIRRFDLRFSLQVPGQFNVYNALAASTCALRLGIKPEIIRKVLADFRGIWRRFELINADKRGYLRGFTPKITLISDYAHHPTAIKETLKAAKEFYPQKRLVVVYQPHHFDRTKRLFKDFIKAFDAADLVILNEIYDVPGREAAKKISSKDLVIELKRRKIEAFFTRDLKETKKVLLKNIEREDLVLIMGAGDIYKIFP